MIIGLVSDTHGHIDKEWIDFLSDVDEIWHAGDIGNEDILNYLESLKPVRAVYGNIDDHKIRTRTKEMLRFEVEGLDVLMIHIGGYPNRYDQKIKKDINRNPPKLFISGHSHILKVMNDEKLGLLHINPGAAGNKGWHKFVTVIKFEINNGKIENLQVFENPEKQNTTMEDKYPNKILNVSRLIEKYDVPAFECNKFFYDQNKISPCLSVILTSDDPGSVSYTKGIKRFCAKQGIDCKDFLVSSSEELSAKIEELNNDNNVHGIMIMYPTSYGIKDTNFMNMVNPLKDVEGLHNTYLGYLVQFEKFRDPEHLRKLVIPPTAKGILSILKRYYIEYEEFNKQRGEYPENLDENPFELEGKRITVINDSLAVGRSLALMLLNENAYVQICHQYTPFEKTLESVKASDIIISAVPSGKFQIPTEYVPEKSIVIDISFEGNFEYPSVIEKCYKIAPRWDLVKKGNRINDMTLNRLISNLHYLTNCTLPEDTLKEMKNL